jgi:hypothetical protein
MRFATVVFKTAPVVVALMLLIGCGVLTGATPTVAPTMRVIASPAPPTATAVRPTAPPEPTAAPEPTPRSITYSALFTDGLVFYENPTEGFAIVLPDTWQQIELDREMFEASLKSVMDQNPQLAAVSGGSLCCQMASGLKFYAADRGSDSDQACPCAATINIVRMDLKMAISLDEVVPALVSGLEQTVDTIGPVAQRRVQLSAGDAEEVRYAAELRHPDGKKVISAVTQYLIVKGRDIYIVSLNTTKEHEERYFPIFEAIGKSFRFVER